MKTVTGLYEDNTLYCDSLMDPMKTVEGLYENTVLYCDSLKGSMKTVRGRNKWCLIFEQTTV